MIADASGRVDAARYVASANCDERPPGEPVTLLVIHNISLPPGEFGGDGIARLFTNDLDCAAHPYYRTLAGMRVSAHFLIRRGGELLQFVPCTKRAWHAGVSAWCGRGECNDYSIGIELEGADDVPYAEPQYRVLAQLARALRSAYPIADIVGHCDIAPGRKTDPGSSFDWPRFRDSIG
ncbi:MAG: N-acetyl-anhydromuranmyl-L-alanine amidase [Betaproteobacteria bacterium RIFCSPLOWO2_12_FULL_64_23]|nr:MAG: N-acetyl-anhydromuranmyl-L-alanine amidase [Betaproteobacteria bacterium RIFCSPLOWO2_12_FULL_64_23]